MSSTQLPSILVKIINDKKIWLKQQQADMPLASFIAQINTDDTRDFYTCLQSNKVNFILECKKASPSKGLIRADFNLDAIAKIYTKYANVISVLTDEKYFQGSMQNIGIVRAITTQPILCKDFIIDPYQVYLARYQQADAILLMLSVLTDEEYIQLSQLAHQLNMGVLTEASNQTEVSRALKLKAKVVGINNRNLHDLTVNLDRVVALVNFMQQQITDRQDQPVIISESGIENHQQIQQLTKLINGFLIGSSLMKQANLELAVRKLLYGENKVCGLTSHADALVVYNNNFLYAGLIFATNSKRRVTIQQAQQIKAGINLAWVGVFQNQAIDEVVATATTLNLFAVQLHGQEDLAYITQLRQQLPQDCQIWQAIAVQDQAPKITDNSLINKYVFDATNAGSGVSFNWQLLQGLDLSKVLLAGGIKLDNLDQALQVGCLGLDFNSGVESSAGIKDENKIIAIAKKLNNY